MTLDGTPLFTQIKYLKSKGQVCFKFSVRTSNGIEEHDLRLEHAHQDFFDAMQRMMPVFGRSMQLPDEYLASGVVFGVYIRREADGTEAVKVSVLRPVLDDREALLSSPYTVLPQKAKSHLIDLVTESRLCIEGKRAQSDLFSSAVEGSEKVALEGKRQATPN